MSTDWRKLCGSKLVDMKSAMSKIKRGDHIYVGSGSGTPTALLEGMVKYSDHMAGHVVTHILTLGPAPHVDPQYKDLFRHNALFIGANVRKAVQAGYADYTPVFLSEIPPMFRNGRIPVDVAMVTVSPPDENGICSLGTDVAASLGGIEAAKVVLAEVNVRMPRTYGNTAVPLDQIDAMVESDRPLHELYQGSGDEIGDKIGQYIADLVEDGSVLQLGIGTIPDAVLGKLGEKNDLGMHTEMFSVGAIPLFEKGVINCKKKTLHPGKAIVSFVMGPQELYEFCAENPMVEFHPCDYTNDPFVIAQNDRMVAINTSLEVDLTGQVCSDSIGTRFYSGIGGQVDFIRGAGRSKGGKPIIALPSTAMDGAASRIVPNLCEGAGVVTTRGDVHYVVTEYGTASLHGKNVRERALALIQIAHPKFRPWLLAEAKKRGFVDRQQKDLPVHAALYPERFIKQAKMGDGTELYLRPIKPTDESKLKDLFYNLSEDTILDRFFTIKRSLTPMQWQDLCNVDYDRDMAIVACLKDDASEDETIIGVGRYNYDPSTGYADAAVTVGDTWQNRGVGTILMNHIVQVARQQGIKGFTVDTRPENARMIKLCHKTGFSVDQSEVSGLAHMRISFSASLGEE